MSKRQYKLTAVTDVEVVGILNNHVVKYGSRAGSELVFDSLVHRSIYSTVVQNTDTGNVYVIDGEVSIEYPSF